MEEWRTIPEAKTYMVSNFGRVKSITRMIPNPKLGSRLIRGSLLTPSPNKLGYMRVNLTLNNLSKKTVYVLPQKTV